MKDKNEELEGLRREIRSITTDIILKSTETNGTLKTNWRNKSQDEHQC